MVNFALFQSLSPSDQAKIIESLPRQNLTDGEIIIENGDKTDDVYFILEGAAKSLNFGPSGQMAYFRLRGAGDFFGYYSAITGEPRTARVVAVGKTVLAKMAAKDFMNLVTHNPQISAYMLKLVTGLLREETKRLTNLITLNATELVSAELLMGALSGADYTLESRNEMAARLGLTRETLSRILGDLDKAGAIKIGKNTISILDAKYLQSVAENTDL